MAGSSQGRRGYYLYEYGSHLWFPETRQDFSGGMKRDMPRHLLPANAVYDAADFVVSPQGFMYKRGGWGYAGPATAGSPAGLNWVTYAEFTSGDQLLALGLTNGKLYKVTSGSTTDLGSTGATGALGLPTFMNLNSTVQYLVIPQQDGTTVPKLYDGASLTNLGGSPPAGRYSCSHAGRLVLASSLANPNRLWFGPIPDFTTTWDTTTAWFDFPESITGIASVAGALLVWTRSGLYKLVGDTPPPGTNMARSKVGATGLRFAHGVFVGDNTAYFANDKGVYRTNGVGVDCLTALGGIQAYYQATAATAGQTALGIIGGQYLVVGLTGAGTSATLICYLPALSWTRVTNLPAFSLAPSTNGAELYSAHFTSNRVLTLSSMFAPSATYKADADGTAVAPVLELRPFGGGPGIGAFGKGHITYDMRDSASDNPTLAVTVATGLEATTYAAVPESPLAETTDATRARYSTGKARGSQALSVKFTQTGPSSKTEIYMVEQNTRGFPREAGGQ